MKKLKWKYNRSDKIHRVEGLYYRIYKNDEGAFRLYLPGVKSIGTFQKLASAKEVVRLLVFG